MKEELDRNSTNLEVLSKEHLFAAVSHFVDKVSSRGTVFMMYRLPASLSAIHIIVEARGRTYSRLTSVDLNACASVLRALGGSECHQEHGDGRAQESARYLRQERAEW